MMKLKSFLAGLGFAALLCAPTFAQQAGQLGTGQMWANATANQGRGQPTGASAYFDFVYGSTRGAILERGSSGWQKINPSSTSGLPFVSNGAGADPAYQALVAGPAFGASSIFTTSNNGSVPSPGSSSGKFLRDDASWQVVSGSGTVTTITQGTGLSFSTTPCTVTCTINLTTPVAAANGGSGVASPAAHTLPINEGSSAQNNTGTGTLGQGIISQGASADPAFISGPRTLLASVTVTNQTVLSDTTHITSSYNHYEIEVTGCLALTAGGQQLELQVHSGGSFQATTYLATALTAGSGSSAVSNPTTFIPLSQSGSVLTTGAGATVDIRFDFPSQTSTVKNFNVKGMAYGGSVPNLITASGFWNGGAGAIDGFQILMGSGNITCRADIYAWL